MLLLTEDGIIAARDKWGRTPIVIGEEGRGLCGDQRVQQSSELGL